jgi:membrane-associated phospholipid phosphatase
VTGSRSGRGARTKTKAKAKGTPARRSLPEGRYGGGRFIGLYLMVTAPLLLTHLVRGGQGVASPVLAALLLLHLGVGALLAGGWPELPQGRVRPPRVVDLLPFVAFPLLYLEVPLLNQVLVQGFQDARVMAWEAAWFGAPASTLATRWPWMWLSEGLHLAYLGYYALVALPPILLFLGQNGPGLRGMGTGAVLSYVPVLLVYPFLPTEGPWYAGPPPEVPSGPVRELVLRILESGSSRGTAFPSLHMSLAVSITLVLLVVRPRWGVAALLLTAGIAVGAVYGGFHYAVDLVAGGAVGVVGGTVGGWLAWRSGGCTPPGRR